MTEQNPGQLGEFDLIREIARRVRADGRAPLGIGDDCAVLKAPRDADVLVTTDMLMDGRHFLLEEVGPAAVGYKALAVNLSDIAAMAGRPIAAFVAVALPRDQAVSVAHGLMDGMLPLAERFDVVLAGGDTNAWDGPLVVSVTVIGETAPPGPIRRAGAEVGDFIYVTGPLGGSLLGRHMRPTPRIEEALALHQTVRLKAMIDLSDGLSSDLRHVLKASGDLGACLDATRAPIHDDARVLSDRDGRSVLQHAFDDGEDFELCFVVSPEDGGRLESAPPKGTSVFRVGTIEAQPGLRLRVPDGTITPLGPSGFDHLKSRGP